MYEDTLLEKLNYILGIKTELMNTISDIGSKSIDADTLFKDYPDKIREVHSDIKEVCELLEKEKKERRLTIDPSGGKKDSELKDCYKDFNTYYLIISDSYKTIKDIPFINELIHSNVNFGFSLLFFYLFTKN